MNASHLFLLVTLALCLFCTGASWLLQFVCYPTYALVGEKEFVPFHLSFGKRLLIVVIPMSFTCLLLIASLVFRPAGAPLWAAALAAVCGAVILLTTIFLEVPKHQQLDREGKSDSVIAALVRDNAPRTACWTLASVLLVYMVAVAA